MAYVKIDVKKVGTNDDLKRWENRMLEKPKCWNKFCLGCYEDNDLQAVYIKKEGNEDQCFLTTLCKDCIKSDVNHDILVNESHLVVI